MIKGKTFSLGQTLATPGALKACREAGQDPSDLFRRHSLGDWGELCDDDKLANDADVEDGGQLLSVYELSTGETVWVISDPVASGQDRQTTTLLLPDDY